MGGKDIKEKIIKHQANQTEIITALEEGIKAALNNKKQLKPGTGSM